MEKKEYVVGIDEAGRGPVLGPMVYGACVCPLERHDMLFDDGYRDSKVLTSESREELFDKLKGDPELDYVVRILSPEAISHQMLGRVNVNLNEISHNAAIWCVQEVLRRGYSVSQLYVDTVGPPEKYEAKLQSLFPTVQCHVSKKADSLWASVSAASICAKVTRDSLLRDWTFREGDALDPNYNFGSGYPGDPTTKAWLRAHFDRVFGFPTLIRFGWSTAYKMIEDEGVHVEWPDLEADPPQTSSFSEKTEKRTVYFARGHLKHCRRF